MKEVYTKLAYRGHNRRTPVFSYTAGIIAQHDIQAPMQPVFNAPVSPYSLSKPFGIGFEDTEMFD